MLLLLDDAEDEESCDEEEQKRAGDLRAHGEIAESEALVARKLESRALLERRGDVGIGGLEGGKDAETDAADDREEKGEEGGVPVDGALGIKGRASGQARVCGNGRESPGESESCRAAEEGKQNTFGDHLPDETEAAGADAEADSQFFAAVDAAREGHGGEIEAGDGGDDGHERGVEAEDFGANFAGNLHARARAHQDNAFRFVGLTAVRGDRLCPGGG